MAPANLVMILNHLSLLKLILFLWNDKIIAQVPTYIWFSAENINQNDKAYSSEASFFKIAVGKSKLL